MEAMENVVRDIQKNVTNPMIKSVDNKQRRIRKGLVHFIDVDNKDATSPRSVEEDPKRSEEPSRESFSLDSLRHWDITMPRKHNKNRAKGEKKKKNSFGKMFDKKRRVTIELYKKITPEQTAKNKERQKRIFRKLYARASTIDVNSPLSTPEEDEDEIPPLDDDDFVIFRILKEVKKGFGGSLDWNDNDSQSSASKQLPNGDFEKHTLKTYNVKDYGDGQQSRDHFESEWREHFRSRLAGIEIMSVEGNTVEIRHGAGDHANEHELFFKNSHDAEMFVRTYEKMRELLHARGCRIAAEHRLNKDKIGAKEVIKRIQRGRGRLSTFSLKGQKFPDSVNLLIEIVSASNLPIADVSTSDPYVVVEDGRTRWHKTGVVANTLNPVWTISTGSLFLIQTNLTDFFEKAMRMEFIVKDYDTVGSNEILGSVLVNKNEMFSGDGERIDYELETAKYAANSDIVVGKKKSYLTLRFKQATEYEVNFIRTYEAKKETGILSALGLSSGVTGVFSEDCLLPPRSHPATTYKRNQKDAEEGKPMRYRLKPFADPSRPEVETKWMSPKDIQSESKNPSREWIETGSGEMGKFYLEIIGCDGLPNLDISPLGRNKSDPFVCIAFEDSVVNTDVINDCLSPRWMPWTRRAFVFNVMHPSSQFFIAVLDHEDIKLHHDKIGRCVVNPTNLRPDTMYHMRYNLLSSDDLDRKVTGQIMFRLRFECANDRQFLMSAFQMRKEYFVSTNGHKCSQSMDYALTNDYDKYALSLEIIQKYWDEVCEVELYLDDVWNALQTVILWRGHFTFFSCTYKLPFHSMIAFTWAILLDLNFDRLPSFFCFMVAWILFATLEVQRRNPNPWKRPRTYLDLLTTLLFNTSFVQQSIKENENIEEIMTFDERRTDVINFRKETLEKMRKQNEQDEIKMQKEEKGLDKQAKNVELSIGINKIFLAPFKDILVPVQKFLFKACMFSRLVKSVLLWRDGVAAFWVATFALVLSGALFFVPFTFLFRWTFRIVLIGFLGPWMKLVDIFFVENMDKLTYRQRKKRVEEQMKDRYDYLYSESKIRRLIKQHRMKMREMEKYMYGKYGARVPIFKEERFPTIPLSGGYAEPYKPSDESPPYIVKRINGQVLKGEMIPHRENPAKEFKARKMALDFDIPAAIDMPVDEKAPLLGEVDGMKGWGAIEV